MLLFLCIFFINLPTTSSVLYRVYENPVFAEDNVVQFGDSGWKARTSTMERSRTIDRMGSADKKGTLDRRAGTLDRRAGTLDKKSGTLNRNGTLDKKKSYVNQEFEEDYDLDFTDDQKMMFD